MVETCEEPPLVSVVFVGKGSWSAFSPTNPFIQKCLVYITSVRYQEINSKSFEGKVRAVSNFKAHTRTDEGHLRRCRHLDPAGKPSKHIRANKLPTRSGSSSHMHCAWVRDLDNPQHLAAEGVTSYENKYQASVPAAASQRSTVYLLRKRFGSVPGYYWIVGFRLMG